MTTTAADLDALVGREVVLTQPDGTTATGILQAAAGGWYIPVAEIRFGPQTGTMLRFTEADGFTVQPMDPVPRSDRNPS
ncbi:hypothetical protein [Herbidospora sp. RD11066]